MTQDRNARQVSNLHLEQYVLGELSEAESRLLEARLITDPSLGRRLEALKQQDQAFPGRFPAEEMVPAIAAAITAGGRPRPARESRREMRPPRTESPIQRLMDSLPRSRTWQVAGIFAMLALILVPVTLLRQPLIEVAEPAEVTEGVRIKGKTAELRLYRNTPGGPERLASGASASAGDVIQVEFHPGDFSYGAIISVDGNGSVTVHWPKRPEDGTALSALPGRRLPEAFRLDDAPGFERFHLLLSDRPLVLSGLTPLIAASARRDSAWLATRLPAYVHGVAFTLKKGP